jgi:hypothetical protein
VYNGQGMGRGGVGGNEIGEEREGGDMKIPTMRIRCMNRNA